MKSRTRDVVLILEPGKGATLRSPLASTKLEIDHVTEPQCGLRVVPLPHETQ